MRMIIRNVPVSCLLGLLVTTGAVKVDAQTQTFPHPTLPLRANDQPGSNATHLGMLQASTPDLKAPLNRLVLLPPRTVCTMIVKPGDARFDQKRPRPVPPNSIAVIRS